MKYLFLVCLGLSNALFCSSSDSDEPPTINKVARQCRIHQRRNEKRIRIMREDLDNTLDEIAKAIASQDVKISESWVRDKTLDKHIERMSERETTVDQTLTDQAATIAGHETTIQALSTELAAVKTQLQTLQSYVDAQQQKKGRWRRLLCCVRPTQNNWEILR